MSTACRRERGDDPCPVPAERSRDVASTLPSRRLLAPRLEVLREMGRSDVASTQRDGPSELRQRLLCIFAVELSDHSTACGRAA